MNHVGRATGSCTARMGSRSVAATYRVEVWEHADGRHEGRGALVAPVDFIHELARSIDGLHVETGHGSVRVRLVSPPSYGPCADIVMDGPIPGFIVPVVDDVPPLVPVSKLVETEHMKSIFDSAPQSFGRDPGVKSLEIRRFGGGNGGRVTLGRVGDDLALDARTNDALAGIHGATPKGSDGTHDILHRTRVQGRGW